MHNSAKLFDNKVLLITGGTGSFGKALTRHILTNYKPKAIRIYSRDELKQWEMKQQLDEYPQSDVLRFFIGDVRDKQRLTRAMYGVDMVVHAAALKQVPACEYNPIEAIQTNINGAINVIDASLDCKVEGVVALSTDKASEPINLYGATKLCSDKLFIQANNYRGTRPTKFAVVRYGNVMGSRGSVIPLFVKQAAEGIATVTDKQMTRFWISLEEAVNFVITSFSLMQGGELFVPKIPSMKIIDLVKAINPDSKIKIIGIRSGEKLHESLISQNEAANTVDIGDRYILCPTFLETWKGNSHNYPHIQKVDADFTYTSEKNTDFLNVEQMRQKLKDAQLI